jgi:hypothetical protein
MPSRLSCIFVCIYNMSFHDYQLLDATLNRRLNELLELLNAGANIDFKSKVRMFFVTQLENKLAACLTRAKSC